MSARFSRGSSVLAALILVVLVGGVALAINTIATPLNPDGLTAQAAASQEYSSTGPKSCPDAIKRAKGKISDGLTINEDTLKSGVVDRCFGAYSKTGQPSDKDSDYECRGRGGTATIEKGTSIVNTPTVALSTRVNLAAEPGECIISVCENGTCGAAKKYDGVDVRQQVSYNTVTSAVTSGDGSQPTPYVGAANGSDQIGQAYSGPSDYSDQSPADIDKALQQTDDQTQNQPVTDETTKTDVKCSGGYCYANPESDAERDYLKSEGFACTTTGDASVCSKSTAPSQDISDNISAKANTPDGNPDFRYKSSSPGETIDCYDGKNTCYPANDQDAKDLAKAGYSCTAEETGKDAVCVKAGADCKSEACASKNLKVYDAPTGGFKQPPPGTSDKPGAGSGGGLGGIAQAVLGALTKALLGSALGSSAACTSDQNQYQQQQQQYQQQMTLYNQQLQQYNYQTQIAQMQGYPAPPPPQTPMQPCFKPSNGSPVQCTTSPAQPAPTSCQGGTWQPTAQSGNSCISGWQCVPGTGTPPPTAQLSCQPQVADVGMTIAISFSCGGATGSAGQGFDTGNQLSGSATTTIANPPAGATKATYGLQCVNGSVPATASCSVDISRPSIILVAIPKVVAVNASSTIGWTTTGMQSCVVSSTDSPEFTAQNVLSTNTTGAAITPALTHTSEFLLHCTTLGGQTKDATTTVQVGAPEGGSGGTVVVSANAEGHSINRGATTTISWQSATSAPATAEIDLWLYDVALDEPTALIKAYLDATGTYDWKLPLASDACDSSTYNVCGTDLVPGREYEIAAYLYPDDEPDSGYIDYGFTANTFTVGS